MTLSARSRNYLSSICLPQFALARPVAVMPAPTGNSRDRSHAQADGYPAGFRRNHAAILVRVHIDGIT